MAIRVRHAAAVCLSCTLGPTALGQSNVRPVAELALPSVTAMALAGAPSHASIGYPSRPPHSPDASTAEDELSELIPATGREEPRLAVEITARAQPDSELSNGSGELAIQRGGWKATLASELSAHTALGVQVGMEASFYDFGGPTILVPGTNDPLNDVYRTSLGASLYSQETGALGWFTGFDATFAGEDEARFADSCIAGGVAGVRYSNGPERCVSLGLAVLDQLEGSPWVFPYLGLDLKLRDGTRLSLEGSKVSLEQDLGERWNVSLSGSYELRQYRLNPEGPLPSGTFRDDQILLVLGLERRAPEGLGFELNIGGSVWQELAFEDAGGNRVGLGEVEPSAFVQLGLRFGF